MNPYPHPITIDEHQRLGTLTSACRVERMDVWIDHLVSEEPRMEGSKPSDSSLTYEEHPQLIKLLKKCSHLFARSEGDLPGTSAVNHRIGLTNSRHIRQKAYRVPNSLRSQLDEKIDI